jgi:hypothetical protein
MNFQSPKKPIIIDPTRALYKWNRSYGGFQRKYFTESVVYRREKAIESFIILNEFDRVKFLTETDILQDIKNKRGMEFDHDLLVVATQQFSRLPCPIIIEKIKEYLDSCPALYVCLTRWYINIDNSFHDHSLSDNFLLAITQWLKKSLPNYDIVDLNLDRQEDGGFFTWVIPDRHYYIRKTHD